MIILESKILKINKIIKKTSAKMFKDLKEGDRIYLSIKVKEVGRHRGTYAPVITVENLNTKEYTLKTFNELPSILECFDLVEC
jgi:hypothetical protein